MRRSSWVEISYSAMGVTVFSALGVRLPEVCGCVSQKGWILWFLFLAIVAAMHVWFRRSEQWLERCAGVWACWCSATAPFAELAQDTMGLKEKTAAREWQRTSPGSVLLVNESMESEMGKSKSRLR